MLFEYMEKAFLGAFDLMIPFVSFVGGFISVYACIKIFSRLFDYE